MTNRDLWVATARLNGVPHYMGSSHNEDEAGEMARNWRLANMTHSEVDRGIHA